MSIYIFDLDGTLCTYDPAVDVYHAEPLKDRITRVNRLYEQGHTILIDTARGTMTKKEHQDRTEAQLKEWGVKYHKVRTGVKFYGDKYIDDRGINDKDFFK